LPFDVGTDYTHAFLYSSTSECAPEPDTALVLRVCQRLPAAARILGARARGKPAYDVSDEYDVQDLLHAVLRAFIKHSIQEEPMGKVAGVRSGRADIAVPDIGTLVEIKFARGPNDQVRIVEDFAQDLLLYSKWSPLRSFVYLVYNSADLRDPEVLEELGGPKQIGGRSFQTYIVLA
jgi:hypothetical protein